MATPIIRLATPSDVPVITSGLLELKQQTAWAQCPHEGYTHAALVEFLDEQLRNDDAIMYVYDTGTVSAFCGGALARFYLPPHTLFVHEWGWFGDKRGCAACWQAVKQWGKKCGAYAARRVLARPGHSRTRYREETTWEVL